MSTLTERRSEFRLKAHDENTPYYWSDVEVNGYYNLAVAEACDRARLIHDDSTIAVCSIPVLPGIARYELHPSVLEIVRVSLDSQIAQGHAQLKHTTPEEMDAYKIGWEGQRGNVSHYLDDTSSIRLWRTPITNDLLRLAVYRLPLVEMKRDTDVPEIAERWHTALDDWALRCAFRKQDSELYNPQLSLQYEKDFEVNFGPKRSANVQRKQRDKKPPIVKSGWYF